MRFDVRLPRIRKSELTSRKAGALAEMCGVAKHNLVKLVRERRHRLNRGMALPRDSQREKEHHAKGLLGQRVSRGEGP